MGSKRRTIVANRGVPDWASFFSADAYSAFRELLVADIVSRGLTYAADHLDHGVLWLGEPGKRPSYGLKNIARSCHSSVQDEWPGLIAAHFDICLRPSDPDAKPIEFEEAAPLIKVRLYSLDFVQQAKPVYRQIADDIIAVLAFDLPDQVVTVSTSQVDRWGRPLDGLFDRAYQNVRTEPSPEVFVHEGEEGASVLTLQSSSYFAATHALFLEKYKPVGEHGVLLVLPSRHGIAWHIIESASMLKAVSPLISFAQRSFATDPGPLSPNLYWKQGERLLRLPSGIGKDGPWFAPPQPFNDLVTALGS